MFSTKNTKSSCFLTNKKISSTEKWVGIFQKSVFSHRLENTDPSEMGQEQMTVKFRVQIIQLNQNRTRSDSLLWLMLYLILKQKPRKT